MKDSDLFKIKDISYLFKKNKETNKIRKSTRSLQRIKKFEQCFKEYFISIRDIFVIKESPSLHLSSSCGVEEIRTIKRSLFTIASKKKFSNSMVVILAKLWRKTKESSFDLSTDITLLSREKYQTFRALFDEVFLYPYTSKVTNQKS